MQQGPDLGPFVRCSSLNSIPVRLEVVNNTNTHVRVKSFLVLQPGGHQPSLELTTSPRSSLVDLPPNSTFVFSVVWAPRHPNVFKLHVGRVRIRYGGFETWTEKVSLETGPVGANAAGLQQAKQKAPYEPRQAPRRLPPQWLSSAGRGGRPGGVKVRLREVPLVTAEPNHGLFTTPLTPHNYVAKFTALVHLEEKEERRELESFGLNDASPRSVPEPHFARFAVPGLREDALSVQVGDSVFVALSDPNVQGRVQGKRGAVEAVGRDDVMVSVMGLRFRMEAKYDVFFLPNRFSVLMKHHALRAVQLNPRLMRRLFPVAGPLPPVRRNFAPPSQALNDRQLLALDAIRTMDAAHSSGQHRAQPFVLFGPPGTGKTRTLVTAAVVLLDARQGTRILMVAHSNSAVDTLLERLLALAPQHAVGVVRLLAARREIAPNLSAFARLACEDQTWNAVKCARVVLATCTTAGKLSGDTSLPPFTHVLFDEAGQAPEPDSLCALAFNFASRSLVVLAGDHKQLGPVVLSPTAKDPGRLDVSLMERVMDASPYRPLANGSYDARYVVQLTDNYRSHPDIIHVPSDLFYNGTLRAVNGAARLALCQWRQLPRRGAPILLRHIVGKEDREARNPSWFNLSESNAVVDYVAALVDEALVAPEDVAVISPYRGQCRKLRIMLDAREARLHDVQVGTVEVFQGKEARVVILSSVRSSETAAREDAARHVGFLNNPKRFNTAVTRAMELLIVVGNVAVLECDRHWGALVAWGRDRGLVVV